MQERRKSQIEEAKKKQLENGGKIENVRVHKALAQ